MIQSPLLQFEDTKTKFDVQTLSNSLVAKLENYLAAKILQQIHYWNTKEYGVVLNGVRWIYKSIRELLIESIIGFSKHQVERAIAFLVQQGYLYREQLYAVHHGKEYAYAARNRTFYYAINYQKLEALMKDGSAQTTRAIGFPVSGQSDFHSVGNLIDPLSENKTKNTNKENITKEKTLPQPPQEIILDSEKREKTVKPKLDYNDLITNLKEHSFPSKPEPRSKSRSDKPKINTRSADVVLNTVDTLHSNQAPWESIEQRNRFYGELVRALPAIADARVPEAMASRILKDLEAGEPHSYWDDFIAGLPIGSSTKKPWMSAPGEVNEMFVNFLTERMKRNGADTNEEALRDTFNILGSFVQAKYFWDEFKRIFVVKAEEIQAQWDRGVAHPNTPVWMRQRNKPQADDLEKASEIVARSEHQLQEARRFAEQARLGTD
jgi:hypothetical protein